MEQLSAVVPVIVGAGLNGNTANPLDQPTRFQIYNYIKDDPGVHFRGICSGLGLSVGVVQYHLSVLEHAGLIDSFADGQNKRYFEHTAFKATDAKLTSLMHHETTAKILTTLARNDFVLHRDLACSIGISSQALSWQMNHLKGASLVNAEKVGVNVRYCLNDEAVRQLVLTLSSK
jgi:predicted transcriptional regulator